MGKKIVLISLPVPFALEPSMNPPLGLCYIAAFLKKNGFDDISAVDFTLYKGYDYINSEDYLKLIPPDGDFYGIYCMTVQFKWLIQVSKYIKDNNDRSIVIAGGPHASTCPEECLRKAGVDVAIKGEGEEAVMQIVSGVEFSDIKGACYLTNDGEFKENERAFIKDLNALPFPDRDLFNLKEYTRTIYGEKAVHIVTLRGCPYSCAFCDKVSVGTNVRYRSIENVLSEMDFVISKYGYTGFVIYDDIFTLNRKRVYAFCDEFKKRKLKWRCWSRTNTIDKDMLSVMKESGLVSITFGVESGDDTVLTMINKQTTAEQNRKALLACKEIGVPVRCSIMYGNPGENIESVKNTIKLIEETQPDEWNLAVLAPIPGSDIWENPQKYGVVFDKEWVRKNNYSMTNRFDASGIGSIWISFSNISYEQFINNLKFLVRELERVCPRKKIQDTIQTIDINRLNILR
ncbi:B12-binding domain-containing radical SAM protein [Patescibacteria group bacterium]|nr:B12-binding domain-containing radical SAM protein [Patescibacteria group bacterium]